MAKQASRLTVICQEWLESERGWGCRPDGASLHLTTADKDAFVEEYWGSMPKDTPDEYSRPCGEPKIIEVSRAIYTQIKKSKNGIRLWQRDYHDLENPPPKPKKNTKTEARRAVLVAKRTKLQATMDKLAAEILAIDRSMVPCHECSLPFPIEDTVPTSGGVRYCKECLP